MKQSEVDEKELISAAKKGDDTAFGELYRRYSGRLRGYLRAGGVTFPEPGQEIMQRCWIKIFRSLPKYHEQGTFRAWLFRVASNIVVDEIRQRKRKNEVEDGAELLDNVVAAEDDTLINDVEMLDALERALTTLSDKELAVFELRREGVSFKTIAKHENCSVNAAMMRLQYALRKLRNFFRGSDA